MFNTRLPRGLGWLNSLELPAHERLILDSQLRQLKGIEVELEALGEQLQNAARNELLVGDGLGLLVIVALILLAWDLRRHSNLSFVGAALVGSVAGVTSVAASLVALVVLAGY